MPFLKRAFAPRRKIVLLEPRPPTVGIEPRYRPHPRRAEITHRSGSVRLEAGGTAEAIRERTEFRIRRYDAVDPGWLVRVVSDGREYEVTRREPQGANRAVLLLEAEYRPGAVSTRRRFSPQWGPQFA